MAISISISSFAEIADLSDEKIREIIARVGRDDFAVAMKAADERLMDRVVNNLSPEESKVLTDHIEWIGPMRLSDVEEVQRRIVAKFRPESDDDAYV